MNAEMRIPSHVDKLTPADVPVVARRALSESHGLQFPTDLGYPVPKNMGIERCEHIVRQLLPPQHAERAKL